MHVTDDLLLLTCE